MIPYGIMCLTADDARAMSRPATVNWVTQTAFAPPLVVVGVKTDFRRLSDRQEHQDFALNMLGKDGKGVAFTFFKPTKLEDGKLSGQAIHKGTPARRSLMRHRPRSNAGSPASSSRATTTSSSGEVVEAHVAKPITGRPDAAILEMKELGDNVFYGG